MSSFKLNVPGATSLFEALAAVPGGLRDGEKLHLPAALGTGYVLSRQLGPLLTLVVHQYELTRDVQLRRPAPSTARPVLVFSFRHLLPPAPGTAPATPLATVRVSSADLDVDLFVPAHTRVNSLLVAADRSLFSHLVAPTAPAGPDVLRSLLAGGQPVLYEELLSPAMQAVAGQLLAADAPPELLSYYLKVKAEELLYLFLAELLKRQQVPAYPLSAADAQRLYQVRDQLLADLGTPPRLPVLARAAGLSESRLKRLFKQVFGTTVYDYYQAARLQEAARLLQQQLTVAEVGYQLGFTNLSHFARLFARHHGRKPKQYSKS